MVDQQDESQFPRPPTAFVDGEDRSIEIRTYDAERAALLALYDAIDPEDRAQGLPPMTATAVENWIDDITAEGVHVVAWHGDRAVGHACLLPAGEIGHELAIFVRSAYQQARIGTNLLRTLLGAGTEAGADRVWLTVRQDNVVARNLYDSAGFEKLEQSDGASIADVEMARAL
jgi:ribosomal protein S18 acetylase RimI-like enzyme